MRTVLYRLLDCALLTPWRRKWYRARLSVGPEDSGIPKAVPCQKEEPESTREPMVAHNPLSDKPKRKECGLARFHFRCPIIPKEIVRIWHAATGWQPLSTVYVTLLSSTLGSSV